jgi:uncharacterized protein YlxP (DUF503 family)
VNKATEKTDYFHGNGRLGGEQAADGRNRFVTPAAGRETRGVHAAALCFDLHVPASRSLKAKRAAVRPIVDTLRHRYHVSVAEVGHQDRWQRAAIAVAVVAESNHHLVEVLDTLERFVRSAPDVEVLDTTAAYLEPED